MLHYIIWKVFSIGNKQIIYNDFFWIQANYHWDKTEWNFFVNPIIDSNTGNITYFAFDEIEQKDFFETVIKISWIWAKTAYFLSMLDKKDVNKAIQDFDIKYFQKLPWIGPKTAKRLVLELKNKIKKSDIAKLNIDNDFLNDIIKTLKPYWFDSNNIKKLLEKCDIVLEKQNMEKIIKWIFENYNN